MSEITNAAASCLCGAVEMSVAEAKTNVGVCHCSMCRQWGGGPFLSVDAGTEVSFNNEDDISTFDSSEWAERGFCFNCGTHLFYRIKQNGQFIIPVGVFSDQSHFEMDHQIFIDEKPNYYCFANKTKNMTGAEVFAAFGGGEEG